MAKGLRSKSKKRFRTLRRQSVVLAPSLIEEEQKKAAAMQFIIDAPRPVPEGGEGGDGAGPSGMDGLQQEGAEEMDERPEGASTNPSKLLKKLRKKRIAATKGLVKGQAKRSKPLAGANQFHKKSKKMK